MIGNLVDDEDSPRQRRQKFLLMSARTTVGISLSDEIKVIEPVGEPPHTT